MTLAPGAPIPYKANRMIGGRAPSEYLRKLQDHKKVKLDDDGMDAILRSHSIDPTHLPPRSRSRRVIRILNQDRKSAPRTG